VLVELFRAAVQPPLQPEYRNHSVGFIREPQNGIERAMVVPAGPVLKAPADLTWEDRRQGWNQENRI
jgi:hypothetical protein